MLPFIAGITYEVLGEGGLVPYIPFGELGFLGIAVAASLQMANSVIRTEEALERHRRNLEGLVEERTAELETTQEQLLAQAQEQAVTAERSRLARDLHDAVTQTVYAASLVAEALPRVWQRSPTEGERNLAKLRQLVRGALAELRTMLFELRPAALEEARLGVLLQQLGDALTGRTQTPVEVSVEGEEELPTEVKITLYRIAQETFNNIAKHAEATQVRVTLRSDPGRVLLVVQDDGRGFDPASLPAERMGLRIMRERAEGVGAELTLESEPGEGTQVQVVWSVDPTQNVGQATDDRR
jgi:signal transduction histidine kinase